MVQEIEQTFKSSDGHEFFSKVWQPDQPARAHVVYIHGFNDRCELQYELFPTLASSPFYIQSHSFDQRGWGKSALQDKQRGNSGSTNQVLQDLHEFLQHVASSIPDINETPLFLFGHSMGGQVSLHYLLSTDETLHKNRPKLSGSIIASPYVGLDPTAEPNWAVVFFGKIAAKFMPTFQIKQELDHRYICKDQAVNLAWKNDPLCHEYISLQSGEQMLQRAADLQILSSESKSVPSSLGLTLPLPTYWLHGTEDRVCAYAPSKALFDRLTGPPVEAVPSGIEGKSFKTYEGAYHKLHCEPDGLNIQHSKDIGEWIIRVVEAQQRAGGGNVERARL